MKHKFPPLWVWGSTLGLVVLVVLLIGSSGIIDIRNGFGANYSSFKNRLEQLRSTYEITEADKVAVIIGSSFTAMAVDHRPFFHEVYQREHGGKLHVIKLYMYGCNAQALQKLPDFFEMAGYLQPDVVCIEEHLLTIDEQQGASGNLSLPAWLSDFHLGINAIRKYVFPEADSEERHDLATFEFFWKYHEESYQADSLAVGPTPRFQVRSYSQNKQVNRWLSKYLPEDAELVCISIPRPPYVEQELTKIRQAEDFLSLKQEYQNQLGVDFWVFSDILPYAMYSGDDHLNAEGMRRYSDWLYQQIEKQFHP